MYRRRSTSSAQQEGELSSAVHGQCDRVQRVGSGPFRVALARQLLQVGAVVKVSVRRSWFSLSSRFPRQASFTHSSERLREEAAS